MKKGREREKKIRMQGSTDGTTICIPWSVTIQVTGGSSAGASPLLPSAWLAAGTKLESTSSQELPRAGWFLVFIIQVQSGSIIIMRRRVLVVLLLFYLFIKTYHRISMPGSCLRVWTMADFLEFTLQSKFSHVQLEFIKIAFMDQRRSLSRNTEKEALVLEFEY